MLQFLQVRKASVKGEHLARQCAPGTWELSSNLAVGGGGTSSGLRGRSALGLLLSESSEARDQGLKKRVSDS